MDNEWKNGVSKFERYDGNNKDEYGKIQAMKVDNEWQNKVYKFER